MVIEKEIEKLGSKFWELQENSEDNGGRNAGRTPGRVHVGGGGGLTQ